MPQRTWFITGVSSGFGRELTGQLLERGDRVVGTVRDPPGRSHPTSVIPKSFAPKCST